MDFITPLATRHSSMSQQDENITAGSSSLMKPPSSLKSLKLNTESRKKGLSMSINSNLGGGGGQKGLFSTPGASARRKLGNVSNTPIGFGSGGKKALQQQHHIKEDSFVKPTDLGFGGSALKKKKGLNGTASQHNVASQATSNSTTTHKLPTVYEEIENMFPIDPKEFYEESQSLCTVGLFDIPEKVLFSMAFDENEEDAEAQKENMTREELFELF